MVTRPALDAAAELFHALGSPSRLGIVAALVDGPSSVTALTERVNLSQPLVSQHLRVLRKVGVVGVRVAGRERIYHLADHHVQHVVQDTLAHVNEGTDHSSPTHPDPSHPHT